MVEEFKEEQDHIKYGIYLGYLNNKQLKNNLEYGKVS